MSSRILAMLGFSSSKPTQDAQPAQQVVCTPSPATHAACHEPQATNIVDAYLNHATPPYRPSSQLSTAPPPPYAPYGHDIVEVQPGIYKAQEPRTLARMLFYYGFLFFPFWLVGIWLVVSPMQPTEDWEAGKTDDEKTQLLDTLRATEKKWARRCLYAACTLFTLLAAIIIALKYALRH